MLAALLRLVHKPVYERRLQVLVRLITEHLQPNDSVLDVGCGFGHLGQGLQRALPTLTVQGVETTRRPGELIPVSEYDGDRLPWPDASFDAVILADVLHHDPRPEHLLREASRVARRLVIIKDHLREGFLAQQRVSLLDWAANAGYGVPCTYRYNNIAEWRELIERVAAHVVHERTSIDIYPPPFNNLLGKGLHYFVAFQPLPAAGAVTQP